MSSCEVIAVFKIAFIAMAGRVRYSKETDTYTENRLMDVRGAGCRVWAKKWKGLQVLISS